MQYPVNLNLTGRRCLVVGGGRIALRKARQLLDCGAHVVVVAPDVVPELDSLATELVRRRFRSDDLDGVHLVITATGDAVVDQQIYDECERRHVWVNAADDPQRCSFTLPAVLRRGSVLVTTSTGGASPALASWLRDELASAVGPELAQIADELARERARLHASGISTESVEWRPLIESLVAAHAAPATETELEPAR